MHAERQTPILCCGGGTPHKPPILRPDGYVLHEGTECAQFLIAQVCPYWSLYIQPQWVLHSRPDAPTYDSEIPDPILKSLVSRCATGAVLLAQHHSVEICTGGGSSFAESVACEGRRTGIAAKGGVQL